MAAAAAAASPCSRAGRHDAQLPHVAMFMARGHTVPLIHLAHLLRRGLAAVTLFTTPANAPFVRRVLDDDAVAVVELPFPGHHLPGVPLGVECVEGLDGLSSSFPAFVEAASALRPRLEASLAAARPRVGLLVADALLYWAHDAAAGLGVPTVAFYAASMFAHVIRDVLLRDNPAAVLVAGGGAAATFAVPEFPHVRLTLADIPVPFNDPSAAGPLVEMDAKMANAIAGSRGLIVNTFDAMEAHYIEHWDRHHVGHRAWPEAQLRELAGGLEASGVDFLWAVRPIDADLGAGFEERVERRGMVAQEWVDQWRILRHGCVKGFLSHCGWNSAVESISAGVPLAVWPMGAEQPLNAIHAVKELRIGVRVPAAPTTGHGVVSSKEIARMARELMGMGGEGESGAGGEAARNAAALAAKAREAVAEGGSSWKKLEEMLATVCLSSEPNQTWIELNSV
uniref:Glycosyltransferase n=1 Tax=Oryza meridionalis TaxID=40149 RepID=A0A0E0ERQ9_9ORYZ